MSWFARSLVNSLRGDDDQGSEHNPSTKPGNDDKPSDLVHTDDEPPSPSRGVKEDLSEFTKTITRQFWGVASFLAPPPDIPQSDGSRVSDLSDPAVVGGLDDSEVSKSPRIAGIRNDFAELGGRFKSGISILSNTKAVSEISKIASTFLPFGDDGAEEEEEGREPGDEALGITEDVLLFVGNISLHPETWLDFPLIAEDDDPDEFEMSDAQQEHALAVERFEPRLTALRIELCPTHMSEGCFWKIYFVLLHSRLNNHDAELLSTPQIVQARAMLLRDLHSRTKPNIEGPARNLSSVKETEQYVPALSGEVSVISSERLPSTPPPQAEEIFVSIPVTDIEMEKHPVESSEVKIVDKSVVIVEEDPFVQSKSKDLLADISTTKSKQKDESYEDDWLEDETGEASGSGENAAPLGNDEDVSFSDLEEDDDHGGIGVETKAIPKSTPMQVKESRGWVQLNRSPHNKDDWLNVDEVDAAAE